MSRGAPFEAAGMLATRAPRLAHGAVGALARPFRRWGGAALDPADLRRLIPELTPAQATAAVRAAWTAHARDRVLDIARQRGGEPAVGALLTDDGGLATLGSPVVLVTFHLGPWQLMPTALARFPGDLLMLQQAETHPPSPTAPRTRRPARTPAGARSTPA